MTDIASNAIRCVERGSGAFCKYICANETGATGSHQCGMYLPKCSWPLFFNHPGMRGENRSKDIIVKWNNQFDTQSRAIYYGKGSRNEYRLTRFGRGFPFLSDEYAGSLFVMSKVSEEDFEAFVLSSDADIDAFLEYFNIGPGDLNQLIRHSPTSKSAPLSLLLQQILSNHPAFPQTETMSALARELFYSTHPNAESLLVKDPDFTLLQLVDAEFSLFKAFEERDFMSSRQHRLSSLQSFLSIAQSFLNRRKARAGKSLENQLSYIFTSFHLIFETQVVTEGNKKPDFIFPNGVSYQNILFPTDGLTFLGAKTTCKDRWRQVLNEADRIPHKYLFTFQEGISFNQLQEMKSENLTLVVPAKSIMTFDPRSRNDILSLRSFISMVASKQIELSASGLI